MQAFTAAMPPVIFVPIQKTGGMILAPSHARIPTLTRCSVAPLI